MKGSLRVDPSRPVAAEPEQSFRAMVDAVRDYAIFLVDPAGRVATWNAGAERIKGYTAQEIIGKHISTFYSEEDRAREHPQAELRVALEEGRYEEEGWRFRKDGTRFWANVVITAIFEGGRHLGFTKVTRDFSERRSVDEGLRQSEERFRLLVESVGDYAIYMLDPSGLVSSWNLGAQRIKGYAPEEIIGRHFSVFYPPELAQSGQPQEELRIARDEGRYTEEGWRVRKNGERFWASIVLTPVRDAGGRLLGFAKVTRDLTDRQRLEAQTRAAEQRSEEQQDKAREAEAAIRERDAFISIAAHELRTPLTALQLKLQGLRRAGQDVTDAEAPERLRVLNERLAGADRHLQRLTDLVDHLLDVSRVATGKLEMRPEEADLAEIVALVVDDVREHARASGTELRLESGPSPGRWDRLRLEQVVVNLLSNAIKYGGGAPIDVRVDGTAEMARLTISDRGAGIPPADLERIFSRFERSTSAGSVAGLGIGLYITRHIVEAHGGRVHATSAPGRGATFTVELPRRPENR